MINLFHQIRQSLIMENKTSKYFIQNRGYFKNG